MGEYISREAALKAIYTSTAAALEVKAMPAADVAPVVRCRECKYWEHRPDRRYDLCAYLIGAKHSCTPEDFCSRGERKGGQDDGT